MELSRDAVRGIYPSSFLRFTPFLHFPFNTTGKTTKMSATTAAPTAEKVEAPSQTNGSATTGAPETAPAKAAAVAAEE